MISVHTAKPVALDSPDHIVPRGTLNDNSIHQPFNELLYSIVSVHQIKLLDLGCAGGGFVKSILDDGGFAVGIEGSDRSKRQGRAEWATIPDHLFTADVTEPFRVVELRKFFPTMTPKESEVFFNVITAWEFFEHIATNRLDQVMDNIKRHLEPGGYLIGSISPAYDFNYGVALHQTVQSEDWWTRLFYKFGFVHCSPLESLFGDDWIRGPKSAQYVPLSFLIVLQLLRREP